MQETWVIVGERLAANALLVRTDLSPLGQLAET